jgi:pimeloyl-ACP methyl ester carboxylesterase
LAPNAPKTRLARALFTVNMSGRPFATPYEPVRQAVEDMATASGFRPTLRAMERIRFRGGNTIDVPVTVAFGTRDRVLLPLFARHRDELPEHTRFIKLPGCGHIAMFDDPELVVALLTETSRAGAVPPRSG